MNKNVIRLNEDTLRQTVAKSVKKVLKEYTYGIEGERIPDDGDFCGSEQYRDFGDNPFCGKQPRFPSQVTKLIRIGKDMHGRPVFQGADSDFLFCDINLGKGEPKYCTKLYNKFEGEPDLDMPDDWKPIVVDGATLNESQLRKIVAESVKRVLKEHDNNEYAWNTYDKDSFNKPPRKWTEEEKPYRDALTRLYDALYYFMEKEPARFSGELYNMVENLFIKVGDKLGY